MVHFFDFAVEGIPIPGVDTDRAFSKITVEVPEGEEDFEDTTNTDKYSPDANNLGALVAAKQSVAKVHDGAGGIELRVTTSACVLLSLCMSMIFCALNVL